ncbi:MAG: DUF4058 family protein [Planctomycetaceae bacterium]
MPSPFPGMAPFLEGDSWSDFHASLISGIRAQLVLKLVPRYIVIIERPPHARSASLAIRSMPGREAITVIELLSPWNKSDEGRAVYLRKRDLLLATPVNLVELDLLRGGRRLPTVERLPSGDHFAFVNRGTQRPKTDIYALSLRRALPSIPIPLAPGDADVPLELQAVFDDTYERAGYRYSVDYTAPIEPPLPDADSVWIRALLAKPKTT